MIIYVVEVDKVPLTCRKCELHEGVYVDDEGEDKPTMLAVECPFIGTVDWECGYEFRPDSCPLKEREGEE